MADKTLRKRKADANKKVVSTKPPKRSSKAAAAPVEDDMADIDCIIEEKGPKGHPEAYLCTWMDKAPPSWVSHADMVWYTHTTHTHSNYPST